MEVWSRGSLPAMKPLILALLAILGAGPALAATVVSEPFPPAQMTSLYIERDDNGSTMVLQSSGDGVTYRVSQGDKVVETVTVHPSGEDWFKFIQALNAAKVYNWSPKYYYPGQGPSWVIDLAMEDRKFNSEGTNEYPLNGNESQPQANPASGPSVPFQLFWQAVLGLIGKAGPSASK
jgi:hypothetical protein